MIMIPLITGFQSSLESISAVAQISFIEHVSIYCALYSDVMVDLQKRIELVSSVLKEF